MTPRRSTANTARTEFTAPEEFTKTAFGLTPDEPFSSPIVGPDGVYVIAFDRQLPSEIPPFERNPRPRHAGFPDCTQATLLAQQAGTNFVLRLKVEHGRRKQFCVRRALPPDCKPEVLPPFSLSTKEIARNSPTAPN